MFGAEAVRELPNKLAVPVPVCEHAGVASVRSQALWSQSKFRNTAFTD